MGPCFRRDDGEIVDDVTKSLSRAGAGMITIRAARTPQDIEACFRIREQVFIVEQRVPVDLERDEHDSEALHFTALADGQAVGTARVVLKDNGASAKIGRVAVCRSNRGFGIGTLLIAAIEAAAAGLVALHPGSLNALLPPSPPVERAVSIEAGGDIPIYDQVLSHIDIALRPQVPQPIAVR